ncbi:MAG: hypothetical protein Q8M02_12700 [Candidatus Didemnitutus sp.]|nr:hypothetical protein [Candidatus Didemnitutus sp.]
MRRSKEIVILAVLLLGAVAFVLWYVIDRRATMKAAPAPTEPKVVGPVLDKPYVPLGGANEGKTIDFSSGQPIIKDTPADRAALEAALRDIKEAEQNVKFEAQPTPPKK